MMKATLNLFKALPISVNRKKKANATLLKETIKRGFLFSPEVVYNYSEKDLMSMLKLIEEKHGLTAKQMNATFHKSWEKVKTAKIEQLILEQLIHYFTTYGFERLGIYSEGSVYLPNEALEIPDVEASKLKLVVINGYKKEDIKEKLLKLINSGIALKEDTIKDVIEVAEWVEITDKEVIEVKNNEVKIALYDKLNIVPENPTEFMRYVVFKATGKTLLIKNMGSIAEIKASNVGLELFTKYKMEHGLEKLAEIFYRFKPLFLAFKFKDGGQMNAIINKIRKLAKKHHKPMPVDYLNDVTNKIKKGTKIDTKELEKRLNKVPIWRKIRLAYALKYRTKDTDSILYKVRNGKGFAKEFYFHRKAKAQAILKIVLDNLSKDVSKQVKGKKIFIPENICYTLPATEKQFTGNFPSGTYVSVEKDMVFGVHWNNVKSHRIDLDLSLINAEVGKIGWDSSYRTDDRTILFSGDVTDANGKNGATELFYVKRQIKSAFIMMCNYFNFNEDVPVPYDIIVAQEQVSNLKQNYMVNPNNVAVISKSVATEKQKMLGLIVTTTQGNRFYFTETNIGKSISASGKDYIEHSRKYMLDYYEHSINLKDVLVIAGAKIVDKVEKADIDLSPEALEKDTILNLLC